LYKELSEQNPHIVFVKVDVDDNQETAAKYEVTGKEKMDYWTLDIGLCYVLIDPTRNFQKMFLTLFLFFRFFFL
jgi:hypothetical protein